MRLTVGLFRLVFFDFEFDFICRLTAGLDSAPILFIDFPLFMQGKTNFFEKRVAEYQKAGVMDSASLGSVQQRFSVDEDF